jgi:hypothetical protein
MDRDYFARPILEFADASETARPRFDGEHGGDVTLGNRDGGGLSALIELPV